MRATRGPRPRQASVITDAQPGSSADLKSRQIRYSVTMAFRVVCFVAMIWVPSPYRWFLLGAAVVLPYVAVLFANQADQRGISSDFEPGAPGQAPGLERGRRRQLDWAADPLEEEERLQRERRWAESHPPADRPGRTGTEATGDTGHRD